MFVAWLMWSVVAAQTTPQAMEALLNAEASRLTWDQEAVRVTPSSADIFQTDGDFPEQTKDPDLQVDDEWTPDRQVLHRQLLDKAVSDAVALHQLAFFDKPPTIYCMRGNTACGKTRAISSGFIPELSKVTTVDRPYRAVNPDAFKGELLQIDRASANPRGFTSNDVHEEGSYLANQQLNELLNRTENGTLISILIDKRLGKLRDVEGYEQLARQTGRRFQVYDVDCPLKQSLFGVLQRVQGGTDPTPPYSAIAQGGYEPAVMNRKDVIGIMEASLATFGLFGTNADFSKRTVGNLVNGSWIYKNESDYETMLALNNSAREEVVVTALTVINSDEIDRLCEPLTSADFKATCVNTLSPWVGMTWKNATDTWSTGGKPPVGRISASLQLAPQILPILALGLFLVT